MPWWLLYVWNWIIFYQFQSGLDSLSGGLLVEDLHSTVSRTVTLFNFRSYSSRTAMSDLLLLRDFLYMSFGKMCLVRRVRLTTAKPADRYEAAQWGQSGTGRSESSALWWKWVASLKAFYDISRRYAKFQRVTGMSLSIFQTPLPWKGRCSMFEGELLPTSFPNHEQQFVFLLEQKKKKRTHNWMKLATLTAHKTVPQSLKSEEKKHTAVTVVNGFNQP